MGESLKKMWKILYSVWVSVGPKGKYIFLLSIFLFIIVTALRIIGPFYFAYIISKVQSNIDWSLILIAGYGFLFFLIRGLEELRFGIYVYFEQIFQKALSLKLLDRFFRLPLDYLESNASSEHAIHVDNGLAGIRQFLYHSTFSLLPLLLETIALVYILGIKVSTFIALIITILVLGLIMVTYKFGVVINQLQKKWYKTFGQNFTVFSESLASYETVRSLETQKWVLTRYSHGLSNFITEVLASVRPGIMLGVIQAVFIGLIMVSVNWGVLQKTTSMESTITLLILANGLSIQIISPLIQFAGAFRELIQGISASAQVLKLLELPEVEGKISHDFHNNNDSIILNQVGIRYDEKIVFNIPFLKISSSGITAIIGSSGSGKSTFGKVLGQLKDYSGTIKFPERLKPILYLRQFPDIYDIPFLENILLGKETNALDEEVLQKCGFSITEIHSFRGRKMGERGESLSGGQRTRMGITRGLVHGGMTLVIDEPTSSLDSTTSRQIFETLRIVSKLTKVFVITHDLEFASTCSEILLVESESVKDISGHSKEELSDRIHCVSSE